jgi:pimeloyl-ACP methyl ester carboxylesterase
MADGMEAHVPNLRKVLIADCGHWTQQEKPAEVNAALLEFLADLGKP